LSAFTCRRLQNWHAQVLRWQRDGTNHLDARFVGDGLELYADLFQLLEVGAGQAYSCLSCHRLVLRLCCLTSTFIVLNTLRQQLFKRVHLNMLQPVSWSKNMTNNKFQVKALLLDLDGTLVDSSEALREAGKAGFSALGMPEQSDEEIAFEIARRLEQDLSIDDLFVKFDLDEDIEERFLPAYLNAYYSAVISKGKLLPNAKATLDLLYKHFSLALITLRYVVKEQVLDELTHLGIRQHFHVVVTALDVKKPKPFPDALLVAAEKLGVPVSQCAIVGDSIVDVQAGKAAGAVTIAVLTGLFSRVRLEKEKPDLIVKDVGSLLNHLALG
jgi:phosphoglycolate phosphatase